MYFNELVCWGRGGGEILNKTQWQRHTGNCYFILNLDHVSVAYPAANIRMQLHMLHFKGNSRLCLTVCVGFEV